MSAEQSLQDGDFEGSLKQLQELIKKEPGNAKYRVFLFQLLAVMGNWQRSLAQLNVAGELAAENYPMVQAYREVLRCELLRENVFKAKTTPIVFGEPQQWLALLLESLKLCVQGHYSEGLQLRDQAYEMAPTVGGKINGEPFEWLIDTDSRLGPVFEMIVNGKYYWACCTNIFSIKLEKPVDLRDLVWLPAQITWTNGGSCAAFIPARYPGSAQSEDATIRLARKTEWDEPAASHSYGLGQKVLATDSQDYAITEISEIVFGVGA